MMEFFFILTKPVMGNGSLNRLWHKLLLVDKAIKEAFLELDNITRAGGFNG